MAWEHLSINKPHLVYIILGGFTSIFMLCSSVIKERLYIGEATVATLCGIIFGPHAADLINPNSWGNVDQITLEFSRIVLVVQCFAVGVELPKAYMERHWRSVTMLLVPVMTFGWLITSLFIWWLFGGRMNWLDSLCCAACVTATDPVLASSVVGKGKFARRVPRHLRDLLSAESGCNDGMAFPFIYLAIYIIRYRPDASKVSFHWFCYTILYECIFGAFYGVCVGYIARRAIRYAHEKDLIDRESFLVFYFVLALFCAGSGSLLGMDDLLIGFACGVGFSNDGWFQEKTEESHVSNVIDLLINLAFFVYFGTIIPWEQYNSSVIGTSPWRLVVLGIFVILFRRIPIMVVMKPLIPDIKTWREALFAGHFGPIGVGAIFVAILARAELETEETTPLAKLPEPGFEHLNIIELIWPITTFLVIISIVVHGSSIAVFTLGKHINTLTLTLSYTQANEEGPAWMDRLPRIQSRSKSSMSLRRPDETDSSMEEKMQELGMDSGQMSPGGLPKNFLRRVRDEEEGRKGGSRSSSMKPFRRRKRWDDGIGPGGPISQSAIAPVSQNKDHIDEPENEKTREQTESETLALDESDESNERKNEKGRVEEPEEEVYDEGDHTIIEDEDGNVLEVMDTKGETKKEKEQHVKHDGRELIEEKHVEHGVSQDEEKNPLKQTETNPRDRWYKAKNMMQSYRGLGKNADKTDEGAAGPAKAEPERRRGPALAYQYGNTIIVEDEDGEVLKKYDIPQAAKPQRPGYGDRKQSIVDDRTRQRINRIGSMLGFNTGGEGLVVQNQAPEDAGPSDVPQTPGPSTGKGKAAVDTNDDERIRFTINAGGRRMSKAEFIQQIQHLDPKSRAQFVEQSDVSEPVKEEARKSARDQRVSEKKAVQHPDAVSPVEEEEEMTTDEEEDYIGDIRGRRESRRPQVQRLDTADSAAGQNNLALVDSAENAVPMHSVNEDLARFSFGRETAAQRRRRNVERQAQSSQRDQDYEGIERSTGGYATGPHHSNLEEEETAAERRRRLGALGHGPGDNAESSSEDEGPTGTGLREPPAAKTKEPHEADQQQSRPGIRFAEAARPTGAGGNGREIRRPGPASSSSSSSKSGTQWNSESSSSGGGIASRLRWGAGVGKEKKKQGS